MKPYTPVLETKGSSGAAVNDFICRSFMDEIGYAELIAWSIYDESEIEVPDEEEIDSE